MLFFIAIILTFVLYYTVRFLFCNTLEKCKHLYDRYKIIFFLVTMGVIYIVLRIYFVADSGTGDNVAFCVGYNNTVFLRYMSCFIGVGIFLAGFLLVILGLLTRKLPGVPQRDWPDKNKTQESSETGNYCNRIITVVLLTLVLFSLALPSITGIIIYNKQLYEYQDILKQGTYQTIEGKVQVLSYGSTSKGRNHSDKILIGDQAFEITPDWSPVYNVTVVNGGILNNNVNVKVYYYNNRILKIHMIP